MAAYPLSLEKTHSASHRYESCVLHQLKAFFSLRSPWRIFKGVRSVGIEAGRVFTARAVDSLADFQGGFHGPGAAALASQARSAYPLSLEKTHNASHRYEFCVLHQLKAVFSLRIPWQIFKGVPYAGVEPGRVFAARWQPLSRAKPVPPTRSRSSRHIMLRLGTNSVSHIT